MTCSFETDLPRGSPLCPGPGVLVSLPPEGEVLVPKEGATEGSL